MKEAMKMTKYFLHQIRGHEDTVDNNVIKEFCETWMAPISEPEPNE